MIIFCQTTSLLVITLLLSPILVESFSVRDNLPCHVLKKYLSKLISCIPLSNALTRFTEEKLIYRSILYANDVLNSIDETTSSGNSFESFFISTSGTYTAHFMPYWPSISTCTLVSGWNEQATIRFIYAVEEVIRLNPVLAGRAIKTSFPTSIQIVPNSFSIRGHSFIQVVNNTTFPSPKTLNNKMDLLQYLDTNISPFIKGLGSVYHLISTSSPLFGVDLIILRDGYAAYVIKMAHCIGDGMTYYNIVNQIHHIFNQNDLLSNKCGQMDTGSNVKIIDWTSPLIASHEIFPESFSYCDIQKSYGLPFFLGLVYNTLFEPRDKKGYFLLCKEKVDLQRKEYGAQYNMHLSPNDIITAALCEINTSTDIFAFTMDKRNRHEKHLGGNYHCEIPFDRVHGSNPRNFRRLLKSGYYQPDKMPWLPFLLGRVGRISSLATIQKLVSSDDIRIECHTMLVSFLENIPMDAAFICEMNNSTYVVLHNFHSFDIYEGSLLGKIMVLS